MSERDIMGFFRDRKKGAEGIVNTNPPAPPELLSFEEELDALIEKYQLPALSNTPSFILAFYLKDCILAFNSVQQRRKEWFAAREEQKQHRDSQLSPLN